MIDREVLEAVVALEWDQKAYEYMSNTVIR